MHLVRVSNFLALIILFYHFLMQLAMRHIMHDIMHDKSFKYLNMDLSKYA